MRSDPDIVEKVLNLLQRHGWELGYKKLEEELRLKDDETSREAREFFLGWMAAERGNFQEAADTLDRVAQSPAFHGLALVGLAFVAQRQKNYARAHALLDDAEAQAGTVDELLRGLIAHQRGAVFYHQGRRDDARTLLLQALAIFGQDHFGTGRVLDTLGMIYAGKDNFYAAQEFFARAIQCKERFGDQAGLAVSHGQIGRLYLDWGRWDQAEEHFQLDLEISGRIGDELGQAKMYNSLGQIALTRGEREAVVGRQALAQSYFETAAGWIDSCIQRAEGMPWKVLEGYARKDRALVYLAEGAVAEAEIEVRKAEELFQAMGFAEGLAHVNRVTGIIRGRRRQWGPAQAALHLALNYFTEHEEAVEVGRTQFEVARVLHAAGEPRPRVSRALAEALATAEACRRDELVWRIERELQVVDPQRYCTHVFQRVRGRIVTEETYSLITGLRETATVLYLDLKGSTDFAYGRDPREVMMTLNQMMADLVLVLRKHDAQVSAFRGDGFLALLRGSDHSLRAVAAALDLFSAIHEFNEPRVVLELPQFVARIGISTGEVFLGNVGTYDKMDYTAIGTTANLGARLEGVAEPGLPCISQTTHDHVGGRFLYKQGKPRKKVLKGLGKQQMWDVVGWAQPAGHIPK